MEYWVVLNIDFKIQANNETEVKNAVKDFESYIKKYNKDMNIDDIDIEENGYD